MQRSLQFYELFRRIVMHLVGFEQWREIRRQLSPAHRTPHAVEGPVWRSIPGYSQVRHEGDVEDGGGNVQVPRGRPALANLTALGLARTWSERPPMDSQEAADKQ
jgi:hypothetical protein